MCTCVLPPTKDCIYIFFNGITDICHCSVIFLPVKIVYMYGGHCMSEFFWKQQLPILWHCCPPLPFCSVFIFVCLTVLFCCFLCCSGARTEGNCDGLVNRLRVTYVRPGRMEWGVSRGSSQVCALQCSCELTPYSIRCISWCETPHIWALPPHIHR